jgi:hypothetical protein
MYLTLAGTDAGMDCRLSSYVNASFVVGPSMHDAITMRSGDWIFQGRMFVND